MSDSIQRELEALRQDIAPQEALLTSPAAPLMQPARPEPLTGDREQEILAWDTQNLDNWIDQVNRQRTFAEDRVREDPSGLLEDQYLSALVIGQKLNIDPGFALEHLDQLAEQIYGEKVPIPTLGKAIRNAFVTGYISNRIAMLDYQLATGASGAQATGIQAQIADWQGKLPPEDPLVRKFFGKALVWTAENVPLFVEGAISGAAAALTVGGAAALAAGMSAATAGAGVAATGIGAGPALLTTGGAALGAFLQYGIPAFQAGSTLRMSQIMIGQSYEQLSEIKDKEGNPISPWLRSMLAMSFGTLQGFLENMQLETILSTMGPGMQRLFGEGVQQVMRDTVIRSVGNRAMRAAAQWGVNAGTEALEEGAQGIAQQMAENLARYIEHTSSGGEFAYEDVQTVVNRIREQMEMALVVGGLLTLPGNLISPFAEAYQERAGILQLDEQSRIRQADQEQLLTKLQQELQKVVESERTAAVSAAATELRPVPPLEQAQVLEFEQPPEDVVQATPGTIGEQIQRDLAEAEPWAYNPEEWARIEQARGPSQERVSTVSIYKDFFDPQMFPVRAMIAQAAPPGFDIDAIEMTGLLLDTLARAQGQSTSDFVRDTFAPGIFATPEQIRNLPARLAEEARTRAEASGAAPEQQAEATMKAQAKLAAAKGVTEFFDDGKALVYLFKTGDISTVTEEFAHIMRRRLPANLMEAAARWAGAVDGVWSEEAEEKFANGLLEYLRQGLAPNEEVRNIFERLAEWLEYIYKAIRDRWQLSPEIIQVYDSLFAARKLGQKLNTEPNPRPADTLNVLFQVDPAVKPVDPDPAHVADEQFLRASVYEKEIADTYFDASGKRRIIRVQGQPQEVSSRTMPVLGLRLTEGQWLVEDRFKGVHGHEIAQLRSLDPDLLTLTEEDYTTGPNWEGRGDDARRYARWMSQGLTPPPITVVEGQDGSLQVTDGHRRVGASKISQRPLYAWVWPAMDHPKGLRDGATGQPIRVGLTFEAAKNRVWKAKPTFERFLFQVDPIKQQTFNKAVKEFFGTTSNPKNAAWILSTGEMLDFNGRWLKSETVQVGGRQVHRMIGKVPTVGIMDAINDAERMGAIRLDFNPLFTILQSMEDPTEGQYDAIERLCRSTRAVQAEKVDRHTGNMLAFKEFHRPTSDTVRDFFTAAALYSPKFLMQGDPHELATQEAVDRGEPVPDVVLEIYKARPWAKEEIKARKRFMEEARSMQFKDSDEFVRFHDAFEGIGEPIRSYAYWQLIWEKAGGDTNVAGAEGFTAVPPAEANKRFLQTVNTPEKMMIWLSGLDALTHKEELSKSKVWQGWRGFPKTIEIAYRQGAGLTTDIWSAAFKAMKTEPERYRQIDAALGDVREQRQLDAESTMPPAEETRLREENTRLRRELKLFRLVEQEQKAGILAGPETWQLTRAEWVARWPADEKKPIGFLERHKAVVQTALREGKTVPPQVLLDYPDLQKEAAARGEVKRAKLEPELEVFAGFAAGEVPLSRVLSTAQALQKERKRLQASVKELEQKVATVSGIGGWLTRERHRLDLVEKKIAIQQVKERLQKRLEECYVRRQTDKANWKLREQARYARVKRDSIIHWIRKVSWYQLPQMDAEAAGKVREILEGIDLTFVGKRAAAKVAKLRIALSDPDNVDEVPQSMLDLLDSIEGRNIDELTDAELHGLYEAIQHWVTMNSEAQAYRIAGERIRAEKLVADAIAQMRPAKEVAEELQRFFPSLWEKAREKGTTILDEFLGIGQKQWILIVEQLAGRDSWMYKVLGQGIEEGRRKQFELKFKYWDAFEAGVQKLAVANLPAWLHESQTFSNAGRALELRRGEKLALFMLGQDEDARASVLGAGLGSRRRASLRNKPRRISEGLLEEVASSLDAQEKGFVAVVRKVFDQSYEDINEIYQQRYGHPLERIPNWYHKDTMPSGRASSLEEQRATEVFRKRNLRPGLPKGRVKTRKGVVIPLYLNSIEYDLMEAINYASTYAGLEIPVYQASKMLIDPDFRTELENRYGERTWKHLVRGLRDVYTEAEALSTVENAFAKTREMMTIAWLSLNPFTALKIFLGFTNANAYVHLDYLVRGYADFTAHPIQTDQLNQALSPYYRDRVQRGFTRDLAEGLRKLESAGLIHARRTMSQYGMQPLQLVDRGIVSPVMRGAVLQVLEEMQAGELSETTKLGIGNLVVGKDLVKLVPAERMELAYRFADFVVQRTQDQRLPEYRSALSRSTSAAGFAKFLTMFGSNTNTNLNVLLRAVGEFQRAKNKSQAAGRLAHVCFIVLVVTPLSMAFVNVLRNHLLKRYGDDEDKDKKMWLGVLADYARELTGLSYFIRDLGDGAITLLQKHRVREFTVPPVQLVNDLFEVGRRGLAWASAEDRYDRNRLMWRFLDKASEWLLMIGEIPLVMPKRHLVEYLGKKAAGE